VGIAIAVRTIVLWNADVLIVTTVRVVQVDQRGMFSRFVTETPLGAIQDVSWKCQGFVNTLVKAGTLTIQTAGTSSNIESRRIGHPERVHELLNDLRNATSPKRYDLPVETRERLRKLTALVEKLPNESMDRVEAFVRQEGRRDAVSEFLKEEPIASKTEERAADEISGPDETFAVESRAIGDPQGADTAPDTTPDA
jgi:hypothetical protein